MSVRPRSTAYERHMPDPRVVERALGASRNIVFWMDDTGGGPQWPELLRSTNAALTVVGGGYLGLWTALLAKRRNPGQKVVLLEAKTVGWAASGRNGGFCDASITHGAENGKSRWPHEFDRLEKFGMENLNGFECDVRSLGLACEWERTGMLRVAVEPHQLTWLGTGPNVLNVSEVRAEINSPLFLGGMLRRDECAMVHPVRLARELARVAAELGVEIFEYSPVIGLETARLGRVEVQTTQAIVSTERVCLATNIFPSLLRRARLMTVPVYDYVLMTEPLSTAQMDSVGWKGRQGLVDLANQFHYSRLTRDNRILYGGYDSVYHPGRKIRETYEERPETYQRLASHFLATFPQLHGVQFTHRWSGVIDTCTRFVAFYGLARRGRVAYSAGFTGMGVGATRFAAEVLLDLLAGEQTERTQLELVRKKPLPFPPEPALSAGIRLAQWSLDRADHREGQPNAYLKFLDAAGLGFDS